MTYSLITDCEFNGQLTIKSTDSKNKTIDINFEFGTQGLNGQIISFSGTKGKIYRREWICFVVGFVLGVILI